MSAPPNRAGAQSESATGAHVAVQHQSAPGAGLCGPGDDASSAVERAAARIELAGGWVSFDYRVRESTAAELLDTSARTLRNWRESGWGPVYVCADRARITYRLADLLAWISSRSIDPARH